MHDIKYRIENLNNRMEIDETGVVDKQFHINYINQSSINMEVLILKRFY